MVLKNNDGETFEIEDDLYDYLKEMWRRDNHPKYQKYFEEWVNNLTPRTIEGCKFWKYCHDTQCLVIKKQ